MFNLGLSEMILIGIIALIFIGPKQLPGIARTVGRMLNELKRATDDITTSITNPKAYSKKKPFEAEQEPKLVTEVDLVAPTTLNTQAEPQQKNDQEAKGSNS